MSGSAISCAPGVAAGLLAFARLAGQGQRQRQGLLTAALLVGLGLAARPAAGQATHLLVVAGIGGDPEYADTFYREGAALADAARGRLGIADSSVIFLAEDPARDTKRIRARSTTENVARAIDELARRSRPGDRVLVVLIGHGSDEGEPKLNLPGPDLSAAALNRLLARLDGRDVAVVNTTSASAGFVPALAHHGRIVITATRTPRETNETLFGKYFVQALTTDGADTDKDGDVSLLEAFEYARREVARAYQQERELQTEHAQLDGDGDGVATMAPDSSAADRLGAAAFVLSAAPALARAGSPAGAPGSPAAPVDSAVRVLLARRRELQQRIAALEGRKASMAAADYEAALDPLLLELARTDAALRGAGAKTP